MIDSDYLLSQGYTRKDQLIDGDISYSTYRKTIKVGLNDMRIQLSWHYDTKQYKHNRTHYSVSISHNIGNQCILQPINTKEQLTQLESLLTTVNK